MDLTEARKIIVGNLVEEAGELPLFYLLREISSHLSRGGWRAAADMRHNMALLTIKHSDGRTVEARKHFKDRNSRLDLDRGFRLLISGVYDKQPGGGGFYGVSYGEKTPKATVTIKAGAQPEKIAKRIETAMQRKVLPEYTRQYEAGRRIVVRGRSPSRSR